MSLRALVVDDEPLACERLVAMLSRIEGVEADGVAGSGKAALELIARRTPDVVLLDVEMPHLDGFDVIEQLARRGGEAPLIVFVTAHNCHAPSAFDSGVVDFLTKPVRLGRLELAIDRVRRTLDQRDAAERLRQARDQISMLRNSLGGREVPHLWIQRRGGAVRVDLDQIDRIAAEGEYVRIVIGGQDYLHREALTAMLARLDPQRFVRVHRSLIVNRARIMAVRRGATGSYRLITDDGEFAVGRSYRRTVRSLVRSDIAP